MMEQQKTHFSSAPMDQEQFKLMMEHIEASNAEQAKYAKKQYIMSQITAIASVLCLVIVLYTAATLIPKVNVTFQNLNLIMEDLDDITSELAEADIQKMLSDVDHLVNSSQESVQDAISKINAIDIDTLNDAIRNLNDAVTPLANFFHKFS